MGKKKERALKQDGRVNEDFNTMAEKLIKAGIVTKENPAPSKPKEKPKERMTGELVYFDTEKQFGFVAADNTDYFLHLSNVKKEQREHLEKGVKIEFTPRKPRKEGQRYKCLWVEVMPGVCPG